MPARSGSAPEVVFASVASGANCGIRGRVRCDAASESEETRGRAPAHCTPAQAPLGNRLEVARLIGLSRQSERIWDNPQPSPDWTFALNPMTISAVSVKRRETGRRRSYQTVDTFDATIER